MKVYTFYTRRDTQEVHIFEGEQNANNVNCTNPQNCICKGMKITDGSPIKEYYHDTVRFWGSCLAEQRARIFAAKYGREVCGVCVSHLYETY